MAVTQIRGAQIQNGSIADAHVAAGAAIASSKLADGANFLKKDGSVTPTADIPLGGFKLTGLGAPSGANDAVRKTDLDAVSQGLDVKASVRIATTANITLTGAQTIDGVAVVAGDRVLVKDQATASQNGIYDCASGSWTRSTDADTSAKVTPGMFTFIEEGTTNQDTGWVLTTNAAIVLATTALVFTQFNGAGSIAAGAGLTKTGSTIDVIANATGGLTINADDITIKLNGATLALAAGGISVAAGGITATEINSSALGNGLQGGSGTAISAKLNATSLSNGASGLRVDYTNFVVRETPTGLVNGSNTTYTLANTPFSGSEQVFLNGILQEPGSGNDYTISTTTITYLTAPASGDKIRVSYIKNV